VADVDEDAQLVQDTYDLPAEIGQTALVGLRATVAHQVLQVVGELHHSYAQVVEKGHSTGIVPERRRVLEIQDQTVLSVGMNTLDVSRLEHRHEIAIQRADECVGLADLPYAGLERLAQPMAA
jgi:hypothetical protein